ncbi:DUF4132 domain-containing protein [Catenuloplanes japonicus]|uniref:DUF4132 domain-containing protein n=1 Tax=Catenuloplanes japonicus TaxID=33876 RepID=UPI00068AB22F|nr:DUF4132 domain-containing protein [Catenuloplanes japonicus]
MVSKIKSTNGIEGTPENSLRPPESWRRTLLLRRGGWFTRGRAATPDPDRAALTFAGMLAADRATLERRLIGEGADTALGERALVAIDAPDDAGPLVVAALVAGVARALHGWQADPRLGDAADHWAARRGLPFAAQVAVELAGLSAAAGIRPLTGDDGSIFQDWADAPDMPFTARVRNRLAVAPDADHAETEALLAAGRGTGPVMRDLVATFLMPARADWVERDVAALAAAPIGSAVIVLASVSRPEQVEAIAPTLDRTSIDLSPLLPTMIEGVGVAIAPVLAGWLESYRWRHPADRERRLLAAMSWMPADETFTALLDAGLRKTVRPTLLTTAERFPRRALRLAAESGSPIATDLLRGHLARHPELAGMDLLAEARLRVDALLNTIPDAPAHRLPPILVSPPWSAPDRAARPVTVPGLENTAPAEVFWRPGEREEFAASFTVPGADLDFAAMATRITESSGRYRHQDEDARFFVLGPEELVRPLLPGWNARGAEGAEVWLRSLLARYGTDAIRPATALVTRNPATAAALLPFTGPETTRVMRRLISARDPEFRALGRRWLNRHPQAAARDLIVEALHEHRYGSLGAWRALTTLESADHRDVIIETARESGVEAAIVALLGTDPLTVLPAHVPSLPRWTDPESLPRVRLRDRSGALPLASVRHLLTILALERRPGSINTPAQLPHPRVAVVRDLLDPDDLAAFSWALFQKWLGAGAPGREDWPLTTLPICGDGDTVRRLAPLIRVWPGSSGHARAVTGLTVLAEFGTDVALAELHRIATTVKYKALRERAASDLAELAAAMGLDSERLADRLVPDLGLDADGTMRLDRYTVGFDEKLQPFVRDESGKARKTLADARFTALKKAARTLAAEQLRRLENAMITGRRWTGAEFRDLFIVHPLLRHVARRLVWAVYVDGALTRGFRVAEDLSLADVHDGPTTIRDDAVIGLPHPLELREPWAGVFADYEIGQPFPQLDREIHTLGPGAVEGREVLTVRILGLERKGWTRDRAEDRGIVRRIVRTIGAHTVTVELDPGLAPYGGAETQCLGRIEIVARRTGGLDASRLVPLAGLDPITASEVARELSALRG